ncbi:putative nucleoside triphosphate pyrophosphohydrolase [Acinetobacter phage Ab65]|nr:putative nucleoside triphosphate pyrophosphohydrolase [Acinetobacter phage Ab31]WMC00471.1 putative nucleoside triphosphate pyrophosphohydrolase [Acinetobacter phage Ab59]WMC00584.1 putative nucleoside triphosphate pyrophosphohydrolase [Acinetobacter phage Ab65]
MNLNELIFKIEQWAEDRNIIKGSKPIDQAMKLFSEFGELADNVGKGRDCRDDIGDIFVVLTIMAAQLNLDINTVNGELLSEKDWLHDQLKRRVAVLGYSLFMFVNDLSKTRLELCVVNLLQISNINGYALEECVQVAYDDIKNRHGYMKNGIFIKISDMTEIEREEYQKSINDRP